MRILSSIFAGVVAFAMTLVAIHALEAYQVGVRVSDADARNLRGGCIGAFSYWCYGGNCGTQIVFCASGESGTNPAGDKDCGGKNPDGSCDLFFSRQVLCGGG